MRFKIYSKDKYWDEVEKEAEAKTTTFHERVKASVATKKVYHKGRLSKRRACKPSNNDKTLAFRDWLDLVTQE